MQAREIIRYVLTVLFVFFLLVLQTTVHEAFGLKPNLLLAAVVCYSLTKDDWRAIVFGLVCGLLLDFFGGRAVGINTLLCMYTALLCIFVQGDLFNNNVFVAMLFVLVISIAYECLIYFFGLLIWGETNVLYALLHRILPAAVYNALITFPVYPFMRALATKWEAQPRRKRRVRW